MALPQFVIRSYAGGAQSAQLLEPIGPSDTTFSISTTVGWTESAGANIGSPVGTSGPFVVTIDNDTDTVEQILCSAISLATGVVMVWTSGGSGRGYSGSTAQSHVPNGSVSGVETGWSAAEAFEANGAAHALFGAAPTTGQVVTWDGAKPIYTSVSGIQNVSLFGVGGSYVGSPPPRLTGAFLMQAGLLTGMTDGSGHITLTFPQAFPGGLMFVLGMNVGGGAGSAGNFWVETEIFGNSTTIATFQCMLTNSTTFNTNSVDISWFAMGF